MAWLLFLGAMLLGFVATLAAFNVFGKDATLGRVAWPAGVAPCSRRMHDVRDLDPATRCRWCGMSVQHILINKVP